MKIEGRVCAGRGIGGGGVIANAARVAELLQAAPYPGTLNVILEQPMRLTGGVPLDEKAKHFALTGEINGAPCLIERWRGAPLHVVEIIAATFLRDQLGLSNGETVRLTLTSGRWVEPTAWRRWLWSRFYRDRPEDYYDDAALARIQRLKPLHKLVCQRRF